MNVQVGDIGTHNNPRIFPGEWEVYGFLNGGETVSVRSVYDPDIRRILTVSRMSFTEKRETIYEDMVI